MTIPNARNPRRRNDARALFRVLLFGLALLLSPTLEAADPNTPPAMKPVPEASLPTKTAPEAKAATEAPPPSTPRELFNAGTRKMVEKKYREAEALLEAALGAQDPRLQVPSLYNLGNLRYEQGLEELKKAPPGGTMEMAGNMSGQEGNEALHDVDDALASDDIQQMVAAYLRGRGAQHDIRAAVKAIQKSLQAHNSTLTKWTRASGDFHSTVELDAKNKDAQFNRDAVDGSIARLVDTIKRLQMLAEGLGKMKQELGDKLKKLKGKIPAENMPPGAPGGDEEEDEQPKGPKEGDMDGPTREGKEIMLTPEQAAWLLDGYKLDNEKRLPMGFKEGQPTPRKGKDW